MSPAVVVTCFLPQAFQTSVLSFFFGIPGLPRLLVRLPGAKAKSFSKIHSSHLGAPFPIPEIVSSIEMVAFPGKTLRSFTLSPVCSRGWLLVLGGTKTSFLTLHFVLSLAGTRSPLQGKLPARAQGRQALKPGKGASHPRNLERAKKMLTTEQSFGGMLPCLRFQGPPLQPRKTSHGNRPGKLAGSLEETYWGGGQAHPQFLPGGKTETWAALRGI